MKRIAFILALLLALPLHATWLHPDRAPHAMVASSSDIASRIGADVMKRGGNAVDAAVAVGLALAVTWPAAGNIGGGGFMIIRKADGTAEVIDYRGTAPGAATRDMFLDEQGNVVEGASTYGHRASAVPGTIAGLRAAHQRHGKLPWRELVAPARKLAADGFVVSDFLARSLRGESAMKRLTLSEESRRIFLRNGNYYAPGDRLVQPELAATLARIEKNPREFYEGKTAKLLVEEMKRHGGLLSLDDLRSYQPVIREPLRGNYRGIELITMPPPSSGGTTLIGMLNMLEAYDLEAMGWNSAAYIHVVVEAMRRAFADRAVHVADPRFTNVPVEALVSKAYAAERRRTIDPARASTSKEIHAGEPMHEPSETAHYSVIDRDGMVVSNTYTINNWFGSGITVRGAGFLMNDDMDDFTVKPGVANEFELIQSEANAIAPGKRPLSSMCPIIAVRDGKPWLAVGSPGGPRIINVVLQVLLNLVEFDMNLEQAVAANRFHHQWMPDEIYWEPFGISPDTRAILEKMGHRFREKPIEIGIGEAIAVMVDLDTGERLGSADPRRSGGTAGY